MDCDSPVTPELAAKLTGAADHDILHYDVDEDYAIDEASYFYKEEIEALI